MGRALSGAPLRVVTTAGRGEGRGHLARSLAIAEATQEAGLACEVTLLRGDPSTAERARARAAGAAFASPGAPRGGRGPLVVDLPDPNDAGAAMLALATVFDDRQVLASPARVVVQPSLPAWTPSPGARARRVLVGYAFAPLGRAILRAAADRARSADRPGTAEHRPPDEGALPRVLLCFGGSDPEDVTARLGVVLASDSRWTLDVAVGPDYRGAAEARGLAVVREPADLSGVLAAADVALLGAGTMKFEAAALGTPAVLVAVADDQLPVGPPFATTGAAAWAGDGRQVDPARVVDLLAALVMDPGRRTAMARRGREVVPGDGARHIVAATVADTGTEGAE